jgi:hypothetical protein
VRRTATEMIRSRRRMGSRSLVTKQVQVPASPNGGAGLLWLDASGQRALKKCDPAQPRDANSSSYGELLARPRLLSGCGRLRTSAVVAM